MRLFVILVMKLLNMLVNFTKEELGYSSDCDKLGFHRFILGDLFTGRYRVTKKL